MKSRVKLGFVGLTVVALYACGTKNGAAELCPPNQAVSCNCPGTNVPGAQVCLEDGSGFDECVCDGVVSGPGTSASTSVGGTSTTASTGAGSTSSGFTTSSGGGPDKGVCDSGAACSVCQASACAINLCKNEKSGCDNSAECSGLFDCVQGCVAMDPSCFNACIQQFPNGTTTLIAFFTCTACNPGPCASDCKGSLQCQM